MKALVIDGVVLWQYSRNRKKHNNSKNTLYKATKSLKKKPQSAWSYFTCWEERGGGKLSEHIYGISTTMTEVEESCA